MKYSVVVESYIIVETDAENEEQAIEQVKSKLDPRFAATAFYSVAKEYELQEKEKEIKDEL